MFRMPASYPPTHNFRIALAVSNRHCLMRAPQISLCEEHLKLFLKLLKIREAALVEKAAD
jgi:hypothetical protein